MPRYCLFFLFLVGFCVASQEDKASQPVDDSVLTELGDDYLNSIELLRNRFRIDHKVEEITMVFFRRYGSAPVVLVRPDGSKIFDNQADGKRISWFDDATYDMIKIKNPTPGPWQAVGQILPESRVMVISDIKLHAKPLPEVLFSGEILKQTASLTNGGKPIQYGQFRDLVNLNIKFLSTNNPDYPNFGSNEKIIATFEDDGRGMDERPQDGTFTGQFNLSVPPGEWKPVFTVATPMFSREQVGKKIMLAENPILVSHELDGGGDGYHKLSIDVNRELVNINTLLIDGKIRFPNGDVQNFSLTEQSEVAREHLIVNFEAGIYRVKLTAYGNTMTGRDFILDVPEYSFLVEQPEPETLPPVRDSQADSEMNAEVAELAEIKQQAEESNGVWAWIVGVNLFLVIMGSLAIWFFVLRNKKSEPFEGEKQIELTMPEDKVSFVEKIKNRLTKFRKQKEGADKKEAKEG